MSHHIQLYAAAGFTTELLPIIPPAAVISLATRSPKLEKSVGKIPGKLLNDGWVGFKGWTDQHTSADDIARWSTWGANLGMQGRLYPAIDIDVEDGPLAGQIEQIALDILGPAPVRFGRGQRRLLVYACAGLSKRRVSFDLETVSETQAVELLADGQQYVVEGIHPKTMAAYTWRDGRSLADVGPDGLTSITPDDLDRFFECLDVALDLHGAIATSKSGGGSSRRGNGVVQEHLLAPTLEAVVAALASIPVEDFDYDD